MAWVFRASDSGFNEESANPLVVNKPAGVVEDDLMVSFNNKDFAADWTGGPAGWTQRENIADADQRHSLWDKVAGATEPSTYSWTKANGDATGSIIAWTGVNTADPYDVSGQLQINTNLNFTAPSITTTNDNALMVIGSGTDVPTPGAITFTHHADYTEREDISTVTDIWSSSSISDDIQVSSGASGVKIGTLSGITDSGTVHAAYNILSGVAEALVGAVTVVHQALSTLAYTNVGVVRSLIADVTVTHQADVDEVLQTPGCDEILAPDSLPEQTRLSGVVTDIDEPIRTPDANFLERI